MKRSLDALTLDELALIRWSLTIGIEWESEAIRCQQEPFEDGKDLPGYKRFNNQSRRRIERCGELLKKIGRSLKSRR